MWGERDRGPSIGRREPATHEEICACRRALHPHLSIMKFSLELDHLAVVCRSVKEGVAAVESSLGVGMSPGGKHVAMGTHNALLSLGPETYLEVISVDPAASPPGGNRWFNLDNHSGPPQLANWVCRTDELAGALDAAPVGTGTPMALARGELAWRMAVDETGRLPFDGAMPALIQWDTDAHPCKTLPDVGLRLHSLDVFHPEASSLLEVFPALKTLSSVMVRHGPGKRLVARISTPGGMRVLQ